MQTPKMKDSFGMGSGKAFAHRRPASGARQDTSHNSVSEPAAWVADTLTSADFIDEGGKAKKCVLFVR